jgi:AcrR family transcriptional regulator
MAARKRQLVRDELAEAALRLLAWQGYESTTVEQIVAAAGVSRRTFFRYFESKDDVIVQFLGDVGVQLRAALAARPVEEPPAIALRHALSVLVDACTSDPEKSVRLVKVMLDTPALRARFLERQAQWQIGLAAELVSRSGVDARSDLRPSLAAAVALAAFGTALDRWASTDGVEDLAALTDETIAIVTAALNAAP